MEENNQNEMNEQTEVKKEEKTHICFKDHCWKMCLGMVVAAFLGGFLATYFIADQMAERSFRVHHYMNPRFEQKMFNDFDKEFRHDMKQFNKMEKRHPMPEFDNIGMDFPQIFIPEPVQIKSSFNNGSLNIEVGLKPFQNDENKVNYKVSGKKLTVYGESKVQDGKNEQDISFSHDFILPNGVDTKNIKKEKVRENLIISIPMK